jgi:hypothetical protein
MAKKKYTKDEIDAMVNEAVGEIDKQTEIDQEARDSALMYVARDIEGKLTSRMGTRKAKENQWLEALRLYLGSLSSYNIVTGEYPFGTASDKSLVHKPETNIVREKCEAAIAQTMAFQFAAGDKNWELRCPQSYELDEQDIAQIQQMAGPNAPPMSVDEVMAAKIDLMEREMETHLTCSDYGIESRKAGWDRAVLGTGILKAPTNSTRLRKTYERQETKSGKTIRVPKLVKESVPRIYRVNPWYFFPDDTVTDIADAESTIEVHPMSKTQLRDLLKNPAFQESSVQACIDEEPKSYTGSPFNDPAYLTQGINLLKNRYLVLEYHGPMSRSDLESLGKSPVIESPDDEYFMEIWVCNSRVIRLEFSNLEGCYRCPYVMCAWEPDPATVFGFGVPMLVRDQQRVTNETWKMMLDNAGISAGPQVIVDTTLIKPAEGGLECTPWKVWYAAEVGADVSKAIQFFMPDNAFEGLSSLFTMSMGLADRESSIPNLGPLSPTQAQGQSATGMALFQEQASSPLFYKSEQWDDQITKPLMQMLYDWEMQYNERDEIKGDYEIDVRTSTARLQSSITQQKLRDIRMEIAQGSPIAEWINMDELIQTTLLDMHLPSRGIVKTPQQVAQERANKPPPPPDPQLLKAQADMIKAQNETQRIQNESKQLEIDAAQKHQEAVMDFNLGMETDKTRKMEAQASVLKAQFDYQGFMAQLAQNDEQHRDKILVDMRTTTMAEQTKRFLGGAEIAARAKDQELKADEIKLKRQKGSGI